MRLKYVLKSVNVISERTGEPLKVNGQRFRYTLGSRMALEGHSALVIAETLDHTDIQNVLVYVENSPQIIKQIDAATEAAIKPLADIFLGKIVKDESEAILGKDASSRICDPRFDSTLKPMGSCSQVNGCGVMAPLNCYLCEDFQAWLDGPHKAVLAYLREERKRLEKDDLRIAANCDSLILAVHDVVNRCERLKAGSLEGQHG